MSFKRIDKILQYALLAAGRQDDPFDRELGPIHLIKYVYLADLAYAEKHDGETFTGVKWQFFRFGPWANVVYERIDPALSEIGAEKKTLPSEYDRGEWTRWRAVRDDFEGILKKELPLIITLTVKKNVHRFGKDTPELLAYVYTTPPMRSAAPDEYLDFSCVSGMGRNLPAAEERERKMDNKEYKALKKKMEYLKIVAAEKLVAKRRKPLVAPVMKPRYDNVYFEGLEWLDSLAGAQITQGEREAVFSDSIWKSPARQDENVPA